MTTSWIEEGVLVDFCLFLSVCISGIFDGVKDSAKLSIQVSILKFILF